MTNVAAFGAFVDIGVHQDGLVHISALANTFVKDPHSVVKVGQVVKVKVVEVDEKRKRIALSMRLTDSGTRPPQTNGPRVNKVQQEPRKGDLAMNNAMAAAFQKLKQ